MDNKMTIVFDNKVEAIMYSLRAAMGTTFGLYSSQTKQNRGSTRHISSRHGRHPRIKISVT